MDGKPAVVLNRTAFYPSSGGQPYDTGTLGAAQVVDVVDLDDGRIAARGRSNAGAGRPSTAAIDWTRRFDHMQQHTGQHVLSAAFDRVSAGSHRELSSRLDYSTIDLGARGDGRRNRPVRRMKRTGGLGGSSGHDPLCGPRRTRRRCALRKESKREGTLRLIEVQDFDLSACGGTHVSRTGAIGAIVVARPSDSVAERESRSSAASGRCWAIASLRDAVTGSVRTLSVTPAELPGRHRASAGGREGAAAAGEGLPGEGGGTRKRMLCQRMPMTHGRSGLVAAALNGWDAGGLKSIASRIVERPGYAASSFREPSPSAVVVARGRPDCRSRLRRAPPSDCGAPRRQGGGQAGDGSGRGHWSPATVILVRARDAVTGLSLTSAAELDQRARRLHATSEPDTVRIAAVRQLCCLPLVLLVTVASHRLVLPGGVRLVVRSIPIVRNEDRWLDDLLSRSPKDVEAASAELQQRGAAALPLDSAHAAKWLGRSCASPGRAQGSGHSRRSRR